MHHIWRSTQNYKSNTVNAKFYPKIIQKALKWPLEYVNFQKILGKHAPDPPRIFYVLQFALNSLVPLSEKNSEYAPDMKHFRRVCFRSFSRSKRLTSLYLVNIQFNSSLHPPPKFCGSASASCTNVGKPTANQQSLK